MSSVEEVVDLTQDTEADISRRNAELVAARQERRKRRKTKQNEAKETTDVVDITDVFRPRPVGDAYKSALGPLRMEFVSEFQSPHAFANDRRSSTFETQRVYQELLEYKINLPVQTSSSIFVRVQESRLDLLRILITGPESTPYEHGIFMFDVFLGDYPNSPPKVKFLTTGGGKVRFNPNLYNCGKVCLSLLGTWSGPAWQKGKSTLLQVLVSIQGLVLVPDPYYNEPGYAPTTKAMRDASTKYNLQIRLYTLQYAMRDILQSTLAGNSPYPEFSDVVTAHLGQLASSIRETIQEWNNQDGSATALVTEMKTLLDKLASENKQGSKQDEPIEIL